MNEACGAFGCVLPKGHNRGQADVPENHLSAEDGFQFAALRRPYEELHAENQRLRDEVERLRLLRKAHNAHVKHDWCPICDTESST